MMLAFFYLIKVTNLWKIITKINNVNIIIILLFTLETRRSSDELVKSATVCASRSMVILSIGFVERGKETRGERAGNQHQIEPTYDAGSRNQTQAAMVGSYFHYCTTTFPQIWSAKHIGMLVQL